MPYLKNKFDGQVIQIDFQSYMNMDYRIWEKLPLNISYRIKPPFSFPTRPITPENKDMCPIGRRDNNGEYYI